MDKVIIGNATLYLADCREIINELTFDSIVCDPPYGLSKLTGKKWSRFAIQKTKNLHSGGTWASKDIYRNLDWDDSSPCMQFLLERNVPTMIFGGNYFANLPPSRKWIVWDKGEQFFRRPFAEAELCFCNFDGNVRIFKYAPDYMCINKPKVHPMQKPVAVMKFCISELPKGSGNIVCDPYMGSGTTGVAAVQMGRAFVGIEQQRKYFETACERLDRVQAEYKNQFPEVREMIEQKALFTTT